MSSWPESGRPAPRAPAGPRSWADCAGAEGSKPGWGVCLRRGTSAGTELEAGVGSLKRARDSAPDPSAWTGAQGPDEGSPPYQVAGASVHLLPGAQQGDRGPARVPAPPWDQRGPLAGGWTSPRSLRPARPCHQTREPNQTFFFSGKSSATSISVHVSGESALSLLRVCQ